MINFQEIWQNIGIADLNIQVYNILQALVVLILCLIAIRIFLRIFTKAAEKLKVDSSVKTLLRTVIKILLYIITFLTVANTLGIPITSMLAVFGIVGLAVSLAAQNSLAKLAGGLMILATHPFKAGDFIEAAGGISGTVQSIGLAYTKVRMPDNKIIMVPNSSIANEIITNFSVEENRRLDINVRIGYEHPIEDVKRALHAAIETQSGILDEPEPFVNVFSYEDNSIQYIVRAWTKTSEFWPTRFRLLEEIKHSLDAQGIGMSYNRLDVNLRDKSE
ncbi:MAG: mechanosensitive ion channel family protein [Oscillospiraceae bacterium]|nr:mechanosensitive ion channel family protein [Oscillospiraceae bacterium]